MFSKSYTLQLVNRVIKEDIIPYLTTSVAKEQAIAMISVLKNVELNTEQNLKPYAEVNQLLEQGLSRILEKIEKSNPEEIQVRSYRTSLRQIESILDIKEKWEQLNSLFSKLIKQLYQSPSNTENLIEECRNLMRKQLNIEMKLVG